MNGCVYYWSARRRGRADRLMTQPATPYGSNVWPDHVTFTERLREIGLFGWLPYVTADAGSLLGGYLSGRLIARGWSVDRARKTIIGAAAVFMLAGVPAALTTDRVLALACIACVTFGFQAWINNVQTIPSDVFPAGAVASVAGLGGVGAGLGAILFTMTTGYVVDHYSYTPILLTAAGLPIAGTAILFVVGGRIRTQLP